MTSTNDEENIANGGVSKSHSAPKIEIGDDHLANGDTVGKVDPEKPTVEEEASKEDTETVLDGGDDNDDDEETGANALQPTQSHAKDLWKFHLRAADDEEPQDWWFASTGIPLLAATSGPLANVLSIAALVTSWRERYDPANPGLDASAIPYDDPRWCVTLNEVSLVCGFVGNLFLLFNFTRFVRYIVALPASIILWFVASGILTGITARLHNTDPPIWPEATYSQGFWHAVIAAVLYMISALMLMLNMLGYALGHYPQHFELTDEQRNLILQTMMFFFWLAGGAGVFARVCEWSYADALYFCDVTVLTVGFGDFSAPNDVGRGLVFPYSVGGIIMLGLMVSSIHRFATELGKDKIVRGHVERRRALTVDRSVSTSFEAERRQAVENALVDAKRRGTRPVISPPFDPQQRTVMFEDADQTQEAQNEIPEPQAKKRSMLLRAPFVPLRKTASWATERVAGVPSRGLQKVDTKRGRLLVLKEEKDRFLAMRAIQYSTRRFKRYFALTMSIIAFGLLWCVGAAVFMICEHRIQGMTYFQGLYFCYVSLLTIGYGDLSPKSNAGKPFFVVWSLVAVPTMTILISDMSDTVVAAYKRGTFTLAAWTILPSKGFFREFLDNHPWVMALFRRLQAYANARRSTKRVEQGFPVGPDPALDAAADAGEIPGDAPTLEELAEEPLDEHDLARRLAVAIRRTADNLSEGQHRRYTYEEWVEYTRLIRFSKISRESFDDSKEHLDALSMGEQGITDWDWIGPDSPMMSSVSESEWILDRLCESLDRYMRRQLPEHVRERHREQDAEAARQRRASVTSNALRAPRSPRISFDTPESPGMSPRRSLTSPQGGLRVPRRASMQHSGLDYARANDAVSTGSRSGSRSGSEERGARSRRRRFLPINRARSIEATMRGEPEEKD